MKYNLLESHVQTATHGISGETLRSWRRRSRQAVQNGNTIPKQVFEGVQFIRIGSGSNAKTVWSEEWLEWLLTDTEADHARRIANALSEKERQLAPRGAGRPRKGDG
jgi:hypothetical protein